MTGSSSRGDPFGLHRAAAERAVREIGESAGHLHALDLGAPVTGVHVMSARKRGDDGRVSAVVILDRVDDLPRAQVPYCLHGQASCVACAAWCWLGQNTHDKVVTGEVAPLCKPCANRLIPAGTEVADNLFDPLRTDGPHP